MEGAHTRRDSLFLKSACLCFSFSHRSSSFSISSLSRIVTRSILYIIDILSNHMNINIASVSYFLTKTGFSRGPVSSSESEYSSYSEDSSLSLCSASSTTSSISWRDQNRTSRHHSQTTNSPVFFSVTILLHLPVPFSLLFLVSWPFSAQWPHHQAPPPH